MRELSSLCAVLNPAWGQIPQLREDNLPGGLSSRLEMWFSRSEPCAPAPTTPHSNVWFPLFGGRLSQHFSGKTPTWNHGAELEGPKGRASCPLGPRPLETEPLATNYLFVRVLSARKRRPLGASITETPVPVLSLARGCLRLGPRIPPLAPHQAAQETVDYSGRFAFPL